MVRKKQKYLMYLPVLTEISNFIFSPYAIPITLIHRINRLGKFYFYWYFLRRMISRKRAVFFLKKFLVDAAGINHTRSSIHGLIAEAYYLHRIPIFMPINIPDIHNLNGCVEEEHASNYFDFSKSFLRIGEKKIALEYALPETILKKTDGIQSMKLIDRHEAVSEDINNHNDLIIREKSKYIRMLPGSYKDPGVAEIYYNSSLYLQPKKYLLEVAEMVAEELEEFYFLFCRMPWDDHKINFKENIRKYMIQDNLNEYAIFEHFMTGEGLSRQLMKIFPKNSKLYIASNLWPPQDKDLFGPLKKYYDVYRYYDFPKLENFADPVKKAGNNTAKLQLIEETLQKKSIRVFGVHYWGLWNYDNSLKNLINMPDSPDWNEDSIQ